jgi:hypothetical protein
MPNNPASQRRSKRIQQKTKASRSLFTQLGNYTLWQTRLHEDIASSPAIDAGGTAYVSGHRHLDAVLRNSTRKWEAQIFGKVVAAPALSRDGTVFVGSWGSRCR